MNCFLVELIIFCFVPLAVSLEVMLTPAVSATFGEDVLLGCTFSRAVAVDLRYIVIEWNHRVGNEEKTVCLFDFGEYESYRPGSSLSINEISKANASLLLKNVTIYDIGSYSCTVTVFSDKATGKVTLSVTAPPTVSVNTVNIVIEPGEDKVIICEMKNFYPKNHSIFWLKSGSQDSENQLDVTSRAVTGSPQQNEDGTFNLLSFLIIKGIQTDDGASYVCKVIHEALKIPVQKVVSLTIKGSNPRIRSGTLFTFLLTFVITMAICFWTFIFCNNQGKVAPKVTDIIKPNYFHTDDSVSLACAVLWFKPKAVKVSWYREEEGNFQKVLISKWNSTSSSVKQLEYRKIGDYYQSEQDKTMYFTEGEHDIAMSLENHKGSGAYSLVSQLTFRNTEATKRKLIYSFEVQHDALKHSISKVIALETKGACEDPGYFPSQLKRADWAINAIEEGRRTVVNYISPNILPLLNLLVNKKIISEDDHNAIKDKPDVDKGRTLLDMLSHRGQESCANFLNVLQDTEDYYPGLKQFITTLLESYTDKVDRPSIDLLHENLPIVSFEGTNEKIQITDFPEEISEVVTIHKGTIKAQMERIKPYFAFDNSRPLLQEHFTSLVILNVRERNKTEHELLQHRDYTACERIDLRQLLSPSAPGEKPPRVCLVQGVAGIGKSVMMQKVAHSWACGPLYSGFNILLYFSFRELNTIKEKISLTELIIRSYPHLRAVCTKILEWPSRILFLFDGLDEFKSSLDFGIYSQVHISIAQHMNHLIASIIKGDLVHNATILITSRPTTIDLDNKAYFNRCAEILGFSKNEIAAYFVKCLKDKTAAEHVFQKVKSIDSLFGLCYVPAFCDILCFYLHKSFHCKGKWSQLSSFPRTITDLFLRFTKCLLVCNNDEEEDPESFCLEDDEDKNEIIKLAQLAWDGVTNKTIIFSTKDIEKNITQGKNSFWKKILTKESLKMMQSHIWQFFHLTHQEFFAALYCISANEPGVNHVHKAFSSKSSVFEIVLRFTAGLVSLSNRKLVKQLVPNYQVKDREVFDAIKNVAAVEVPKEDTLTPENIVKYTAHKRQKLTASHCLYEAANENLTQQVASQTSDTVNFSYISLNVTDCTAIANLLSYHTTIETLELDGCKAGPLGFQRLESVFSRVKTLSLEGNMLEDEGAEIIANALRSKTCRIEILRLKHNSIQEKGAAQIADALKTNSSLKTLGLRANSVRAKGARSIAEALEMNTTLRVFGLQFNKIGDEGAMYMAEAMKKNRSLVELRLGDNGISEKGSDYFRSALEVNDTLEELWILVNNISNDGKERLKNANHKNPNIRLN
ncbi:NLR family CARD domain-containing protein 3-like isoform X1 [Chiloscyllium plagiosum]|uniref:NLR family CARD domain-containing protein 3-like isoform X1 n=1 Tax=Chiloscyllium plagiosum TaxID=36176 RepID=UPI001CB820E1|nr:NLR family CARD domain-containing protein 3-like isoform X1 [Chiloscyllium plagiosum]XP_043562817.1 NLR family CARD domain-containing protein 3-like isoform X1 [Chiloscyllium plagiosum]